MTKAKKPVGKKPTAKKQTAKRPARTGGNRSAKSSGPARKKSAPAKAKPKPKPKTRPRTRPKSGSKTTRRTRSKRSAARALNRPLTIILALAAGLLLAAAAWYWWPVSGPDRPATPPPAKSAAKVHPTKPQTTGPRAVKPAPPLKAKPAPPVYEAGPDPFQRRLARLDAAVWAGLQAAGIGDGRIGFTRVVNVREGGHSFDRVELGLDLGGTDPDRVEQALLRQIGRAGVKASLTTDHENGRPVLKVWLDARLTHTLILNGHRAPPPAGRGRAAIIIDDMGHHPRRDAEFLSLGLPLTVAVLPGSAGGAKLGRTAAAQGLEVMLHLPMEPQGYPRIDPGPGALLAGMSPQELLDQLKADLAKVPQAKGVNNHMGSRLTADGPAMAVVMAELKHRGLFFVDSRTSPHSRALEMAQKHGVPAVRRTIFLDNLAQVEAVKAQLRRLIAQASGRGWAVAIGHPHRATLTALRDMAAELKQRLVIVPASALAHNPPPG